MFLVGNPKKNKLHVPTVSWGVDPNIRISDYLRLKVVANLWLSQLIGSCRAAPVPRAQGGGASGSGIAGSGLGGNNFHAKSKGWLFRQMSSVITKVCLFSPFFLNIQLVPKWCVLPKERHNFGDVEGCHHVPMITMLPSRMFNIANGKSTKFEGVFPVDKS